jgi:hypothetical protein
MHGTKAEDNNQVIKTYVIPAMKYAMKDWAATLTAE